jgi:hypothetical protein
MYIISKFKDYYDGAVGMGIDKTIVYERKTEQKKLLDQMEEKLLCTGWRDRYTNPSAWGDQMETDVFIVGFCGKLYLGWLFMENKRVDMFRTEKSFTLTYDPEEALKKFNFHNGKHSWEKFKEERLHNHIEKIKNVDPHEWFVELNSPVFVLGYGRNREDAGSRTKMNKNEILFVNPCLKNYDFVKIIDPYTTFQEVMMYISGVLTSNEDGPQPKMNEKQKLGQHGFDFWSFKKRPKSK